MNEKPKKKKKGKGGRPSTVTEDRSALFITAIENGLPIGEAQDYAGFSDDAYRRKLVSDPSFAEKVRIAQNKLVIASRSNVADEIVKKKNVKVSQWYLSNKRPEEFGKGDGDSPFLGLPAGTAIIVPAAGAHPRIVPESNAPTKKA